MIYKIYNDRLNTVSDSNAVYGDTISYTFNNFNLDQTDATLSGDTVVMNFSYKGSVELLKAYTGVITGNSAAFTLDTAELPNAGQYCYQLRNETDDFTLASGGLTLFSLVE